MKIFDKRSKDQTWGTSKGEIATGDIIKIDTPKNDVGIDLGLRIWLDSGFMILFERWEFEELKKQLVIDKI